MAHGPVFGLATICGVLFFSVAIAVKPPPRKNLALYECLIQQICKCGVSSRFDTCWDKLTNASRTWMIDELNTCEMDVTVPYGSLKEWTDLMCPQGDDVNQPCYHQMNQKLMERVKKAGTGEYGEEETIAFELGRKCLEPNIAFCSTFAGDCMSVG